MPPTGARVVAMFFVIIGAFLWPVGQHTISGLVLIVAVAFVVLGGATVVRMQRSLDRFLIERGGIVRALRKIDERRLSSMDRAALDAHIGSKYEIVARAVVRTKDGETIPIVQDDTLARNRALVESMNRFLTHGQFGAPSVRDIFLDALQQPGGTVIVYATDTGGTQYSMFPVANGTVTYYWRRPGIEISIGGTVENTVAQILRECGVHDVIETSAGVKGQLGSDVARAEAVAHAIATKLWKTSSPLDALYSTTSYLS